LYQSFVFGTVDDALDLKKINEVYIDDKEDHLRHKVDCYFTPLVNSIVRTYLPKHRGLWFDALGSPKFAGLFMCA
jgi:hypothetical protein